MNTPIVDNSILDILQLQDVTTYLGRNGWSRQVDFPRKDIVVFYGPLGDRGKPLQLVIPVDPTGMEFRAHVDDIIKTISVIEKRDPASIVHDMLRPNADRLQLRIVTDMGSGGALPLDFATKCVQGLRDLISYTACSEEEARPFFYKSTKIGAVHASQCMLGQTQVGSFILNIECPLFQAGQQVDFADIPFSRKVTTRLMRGIGSLQEALLDGKPDRLVDKYQVGLNANM
jgi:hypothetical protein